jgi:uncharacterized protein YjcR
MSKFSEETIQKCIRLYLEGESYKHIAELAGVSENQARKIVQTHYILKGGHRRARHAQMQGERHNRAKIDNDEVLALLKDYNERLMDRAELAEKYGIHVTQVSGIIRGRTRTDCPEINAYRREMEVRDGRQRRRRTPAAKKSETKLHHSSFNND